MYKEVEQETEGHDHGAHPVYDRGKLNAAQHFIQRVHPRDMHIFHGNTG